MAGIYLPASKAASCRMIHGYCSVERERHYALVMSKIIVFKNALNINILMRQQVNFTFWEWYRILLCSQEGMTVLWMGRFLIHRLVKLSGRLAANKLWWKLVIPQIGRDGSFVLHWCPNESQLCTDVQILVLTELVHFAKPRLLHTLSRLNSSIFWNL